MFLLSRKVSGWFGRERGTHLPIIPGTWFISKCWTSIMRIEDRVKEVSIISHFKEYKN